MTVPSFDTQRNEFNSLRDSIDRELRETGFCEFIETCGLNPNLGRLVVGRSFTYSTQQASIDTDLDPLATRLETMHEVGLSIESSDFRSYMGIIVSQAIHGEYQEPVTTTPQLDYIQFVVVESGISKLLKARSIYPYITKSLLKVDPFGD